MGPELSYNPCPILLPSGLKSAKFNMTRRTQPRRWRQLGADDPEGVELVKANEAVVVGVEIDHESLELVVGDGGAEGREDVAELVDRDLAVAVGVEAFEDLPDLVGDGGFGVGGGWSTVGCHGGCGFLVVFSESADLKRERGKSLGIYTEMGKGKSGGKGGVFGATKKSGDNYGEKQNEGQKLEIKKEILLLTLEL